jgi:hypothetical protein
MTLALLLLQIVVILAACWPARKVLRWIGQPPVTAGGHLRALELWDSTFAIPSRSVAS